MNSTSRYADERYAYYPMSRPRIALGSMEEELVINATCGQMLLINWHQRCVIEICMFQQEQFNIVEALVHAWPSYVENDKLLCILLQQPKARVVQLLDSDRRAEVLRSLDLLLESCREQLLVVGIEIRLVEGFGYKLGRFVAENQGEQEVKA